VNSRSQADALRGGRAAFDDQAWARAYTALTEAARAGPLEPEDLVRQATAAVLSGHDEESDELQSRAYQIFSSRGDASNAARCAFWLGTRLLTFGETIRGGGWLARARRILDETHEDCVEQGYILAAEARQLARSGDVEAARSTLSRAHEIGRRFVDNDLIAMAMLGMGTACVQAGETARGLAALDEVMIAVEAREVSPVVSGVLYCAVIDVCHQVFDLRRAHEWTEGLDRWCASQPELVPFRGQCQVHRAQVLQLHGAWPAALTIAESVTDARSGRSSSPAIGPALYEQAELHRLRGEFARAEEAYREATRCGHPPEPGLALLRLAQGNVDAAAATITRALDELNQPLARAALLPAFVQIMLSVGDRISAHRGAEELASVVGRQDVPFLRACSAYAAGCLLLAESEPRAALIKLRTACDEWLRLEAPYEAARTRELIGLACRALRDEDRARLELDAAARALRQLGAAPDLARVEGYTRSGAPREVGGLTQREVQVLRLLATGKTNRRIADELVLSEKTVARHVSNIFTKLGLSSRSAATAYAYEHALV
jgi:DNA-binding NarL/FixJ family response regulator